MGNPNPDGPFLSNVSARELMSVDFCRTSDSRAHFADLCRMSRLACSCQMQMQIPSDVSARVLISESPCSNAVGVITKS